MKKTLEFAEKGFTVAYLLLYSGGPLAVILAGGRSEGEGAPVEVDSSLIQALFLLNYLVTFFLLIARWKSVVYVLRKDKFICLLVGLAVFSILWSFAPSKTIVRSVALVGTSLFGLYLSTRYSSKQQLQMLGWTFGTAVVLSFVFGLALRKYGVMGGVHAGAWRGIYTHKNVLGKEMVLSVIIFLLLGLNSKKNRLLLWCGCSLSLILLLLSTSKTSLVNLLMLLVALAAYGPLRWQYHLMVPAFTAIATVGGGLRIWLAANADTLLGAMGKDASLTGRTDIWPAVLEMIWKHPWLGYGYSGFWLGLQGESAYVWYAIGFKVPNAHNGLLDLWLNLGLVGVVIFGIGFLITFLRSLVWVRLSKTSEGLWPIIFMTYLLLANLAESSLMIQNDLFWVLYVAVAFSVLLPPERPDKAIA